VSSHVLKFGHIVSTLVVFLALGQAYWIVAVEVQDL